MSWFPWFRFYGPEKALFDKSWKMPDIERMNWPANGQTQTFQDDTQEPSAGD
jgi:hypothetical protein